jgi:hypothetical protein
LVVNSAADAGTSSVCRSAAADSVETRAGRPYRALGAWTVTSIPIRAVADATTAGSSLNTVVRKSVA